MKYLRALISSLKNVNENNILYREIEGRDGMSFHKLSVKLSRMNGLFPIQSESA